MQVQVDIQDLLKTRLDVSLEQIGDFCRRWQISELALFGSVLRDDFSDASDVDLLVSYGDGARFGLRDFLLMRDELEGMFGRSPDLLEKDLIENPFLRSEVLGSAVVIYGAE
jgi:predicted nucleotidyltransferase